MHKQAAWCQYRDGQPSLVPLHSTLLETTQECGKVIRLAGGRRWPLRGRETDLMLQPAIRSFTPFVREIDRSAGSRYGVQRMARNARTGREVVATTHHGRLPIRGGSTQ